MNQTRTTTIAACVTVSLVLLFVVILGLLHILKPEIDPSWRMISEYEIGQYGWMMQGAFFCLAIALGVLFIALRPHVRSRGGYVGLGLLLISAVGAAMGGAFVTDPITTSRADQTTTSLLHGIGGMMVIFPAPFLATFISWSLVKHSQQWKRARFLLLWPVVFIWAALITFLSVVIMAREGAERAGPSIPVGWPNRAFIVAFCVWAVLVAWQAAKIHSDSK